jgi:hypothetical protein
MEQGSVWSVSLNTEQWECGKKTKTFERGYEVLIVFAYNTNCT